MMCHVVWYAASDPDCWGITWRMMDGAPKQPVRTTCPEKAEEEEWKGSSLSLLGHCLTCHEM